MTLAEKRAAIDMEIARIKMELEHAAALEKQQREIVRPTYRVNPLCISFGVMVLSWGLLIYSILQLVK